jgi:hypothetical protein
MGVGPTELNARDVLFHVQDPGILAVLRKTHNKRHYTGNCSVLGLMDSEKSVVGLIQDIQL